MLLAHPFVPQGLLALFMLAEGLKCVGVRYQRISIALLLTLFAYAFYAHVCVDVRYLHVMLNNHASQALHYRIASLWSHHETSLFVWLCVLNAATYIWRLPADLVRFKASILGFLNCCFAFYMLVEANPFSTTPFAQLAAESQGLNPLLYDMNMVWHPPLLYLGATMLFMPYVIALWLRQNDDIALAQVLQYQTKIAFGVLTLAIALGSLWAFTQLGWGGFWFWDPVETASLLPWVAALIVFHNKPQTIKNNPWIAGLPFACVMISLWAVRSGMLVSVHSFANDVMAFWLLGAFAFFTLMPLIVMFIKARLLSVEFTFMTMGLLCLSLTLVLLFLALFLPVIFNFSLAPSFFNVVLLPVWCLIALLMALAPNRLAVWTSLNTSLLALAAYLSFYAHLSIPYLLLGCCGALCVGSMFPLLWRKTQMALAHIGIGLCLVGLASYSDSSPEQTLILTHGMSLKYGLYALTYEDDVENKEPFKIEQGVCIRIDLHAFDEKILKTLHLTPAKQFFHSSQLQRAKADFGFLDTKILLISTIERLSDRQVAIVFHEKIGLLWVVFGCVFMIFGLLIFAGKWNLSAFFRLFHHQKSGVN